MADDRQGPLHGTTCLVTGVTSGIGKVTALELARRGAHVVGVARDRARGEAAAADIRGRAPAGEVDLLVADLAELDAVRGLARQVLDRYPRVQVLVNNAGVAKFQRQTTGDGLEVMFATNHLAPFLLTNLLLDRLTESAPARVVNVSSAVHKQVRAIPWDDLQSERKKFNGLEVYNLTKLLNLLFTVELDRRLEGTGVTANAANPGFLHTGLGREATGGTKVFFTLARPFQKSPERGAETSVHLAAAPDVAGTSGRYFQKCQPVEPSARAQDRDAAARLWELSARLCGLDQKR